MSHAVVEALGWALIHSMWECAVAAVAFAAFRVFIHGANARYIAGCVTMLAMLAAPAATFLSILNTTRDTPGNVATAAAEPARFAADRIARPQTPSTGAVPSVGTSTEYLPLAVWAWMTGVIALSVWETGAWVVAQRLKRRSRRPLSHVWEVHFTALCARMQVRRTVALYESAIAKVPAVIGCLRPVILVPAGALLNLSAQELEAILAHELAHVRRFDYLANLLQTAIETLLFYHPAVWWVGKCVRAEREHCCDDMAVRACGDRLVYARALTSLEELRGAAPHVAMAATGGVLSQRIHRLLGKPQPLRRSLPVWLLGALTLLIAIALVDNTRPAHAAGAKPMYAAAPAPFAAEVGDIDESPRPAPTPAHRAIPAPTAPAPRAFTPAAPAQTPAPEPAVLTAPAPETVVTPAPAPFPGIVGGVAGQGPSAAPPPSGAPRTPGPVTGIVARGDGFLAGLADAGYTNISVDDIIELKQNGVSPSFIKGMLQAGFGLLTPRQLIALHANGISPDYAHAVKAAGIRELKVEDVIRLRQNGVRADLVEALVAAGYKDATVAQVIDAQNNGLSGSALRSVRDQGFKNLTLEQVIKLKRAGVI